MADFTVDTRNSRADISVLNGRISKIKVYTSYGVPIVYQNPTDGKILEITDKLIDFENLISLTKLLKEIKTPELKNQLKKYIFSKIYEIEEYVKKV